MTKDFILALAGHVLSTGEATSEEAKRLAAKILGDPSIMSVPTRSKEDMIRILSKIDGVEGQAERAAAIRAQLEAMG